jgi:hypothetical protein
MGRVGSGAEPDGIGIGGDQGQVESIEGPGRRSGRCSRGQTEMGAALLEPRLHVLKRPFARGSGRYDYARARGPYEMPNRHRNHRLSAKSAASR